MRAVVTGATGFIGRRLLDFIDEPIVLTRDAAKARRELGSRVKAYDWDLMTQAAPAEALSGVDAVFHLAGEPVAEGRWDAAKKQRLRESRTVGTANLVRGLSAAQPRPPVLVSASAIGYYGSRGDDVLDETAAPGSDFLAKICGEWECEAAAAEKLGIRVASARIGIVLGRGGALKKMLLPFKLGVGGRLASGSQWMSWVHVDDVVGMMLHAATNAEVRGAFNAVGPAPVTNAEFTRTLGRVLHRPTIFPVPGFALRLAFGEFGNILLASQRCAPRRMQEAGYTYRFPTLEGALTDAVHGGSNGSSAAMPASAQRAGSGR